MTGFEIRDSEIDTTVLAQRMAQNIAARRARASELGLDFEAIAGLTPVDNLDEALTLIQLSYTATQLKQQPLGPSVRPWRHPLHWFKQQAHALAVYYVNRLGYRQMVFNSGVLQVLEYLLAEHKAEVSRLRAQVVELSERLLSIEQQER